jgi:hypothetical protein
MLLPGLIAAGLRAESEYVGTMVTVAVALEGE